MPKAKSSRGSYYSSREKDLVRSQFALPLVGKLHSDKSRQLRYFGMPGGEAKDLTEWHPFIDHVEAVDFDDRALKKLRDVLATAFPGTRYRLHYGDADQVILKNGSRGLPWLRRPGWTQVSQSEERWTFDVVYLDYFGKFLPYDQGSRPAQRRAKAIRKLFASDREDAYDVWLLMITVESTLFRPMDKGVMRSYLTRCREQAQSSVKDVLKHYLAEGLHPTLEAARLIKGTLAYMISMAAGDADVAVAPRGMVVYKGASGTPMLHFAYELRPAGTLSGPVDPLPLLRAPTLKPLNPAEWPWLEVLPEESPGLTPDEARSALVFLESDQLDSMVRVLR